MLEREENSIEVVIAKSLEERETSNDRFNRFLVSVFILPDVILKDAVIVVVESFEFLSAQLCEERVLLSLDGHSAIAVIN